MVRASTGFTEMTKMRAAIQEFDPYVAKETLVLMGLMKLWLYLVLACDIWGVFTNSWWVRDGLDVRCAVDFTRRSGAQLAESRRHTSIMKLICEHIGNVGHVNSVDGHWRGRSLVARGRAQCVCVFLFGG